MKSFWLPVCFLILLIQNSCDKEEPRSGSKNFTLTNLQVDARPMSLRYSDVSTSPQIVLSFSEPLNRQSAEETITLGHTTGSVPLQFSFSNNDSTVTVSPGVALKFLSTYNFQISQELTSINNKQFGSSTVVKLVTRIDESDKFTRISDEALLDLVQQQSFKYFWDFAHPASGMARERNTSGNIVSIGGSGFGIMAVIVAIEKKFITREEGVERLNKIVAYLEKADRFHGVWPHWADGNTGKVIPFSTKDNGGDLVETSFLVQGLLTFRQYLTPADTVGNNLIRRINTLWEAVEWDWYRKNNENVLYWHWSPNFNWDMNLPLYGYFEEQITYFLAAASPSHSIPKVVYTNGYGKNGAIVKNNTYYGIKLPLESPAPLFWVHYSYLGLDPHFSDDYANYWEQNVNASRIHHAYCVSNPKKYAGYSDMCWGLTSSDNQNGYAAHSPGNDLGVIAPTAALSSFPYTPQESMKALQFFYYKLGDKLWGPYGFYDAFNLSEGWIANSYLAIDQGPIIIMIENYRTGLLWDLFMSAPEVQNGMTKLGFQQ
ncbi:MAG: glucoamylase family protein [Bacteroidota bacterium]